MSTDHKFFLILLVGIVTFGAYNNIQEIDSYSSSKTMKVLGIPVALNESGNYTEKSTSTIQFASRFEDISQDYSAISSFSSKNVNGMSSGASKYLETVSSSTVSYPSNPSGYVNLTQSISK